MQRQLIVRAINDSLGATSTVSTTDPASIAIAASQSVPIASMQAGLDQLAALGANPIETLSVVQALQD